MICTSMCRAPVPAPVRTVVRVVHDRVEDVDHPETQWREAWSVELAQNTVDPVDIFRKN